MERFRFLTSGESHGKCLTAIIEGIPAGFKIKSSVINEDLARRQVGYGRGARMQIEKDTVEIKLQLIEFAKGIYRLTFTETSAVRKGKEPDP